MTWLIQLETHIVQVYSLVFLQFHYDISILREKYEGKCNVQGYTKNNSCKIISYSSGEIISEFVKYEVIFECEVCYPVEGMIIPCVATEIIKAGIRAESTTEKPSPVTVL